MRETKDKLINLLTDVAKLVDNAHHNLAIDHCGKYFGKKRHGVIGRIRNSSIVANVNHWGGLSFIVEIYYTPMYLIPSPDAEEVIRISIDEMDDFVIMDDPKALELLLEVAD